MFSVTYPYKSIGDGKGVHMTFANGWTISIQWGANNYCDNRSMNYNAPVGKCNNAEVAVWDKDGNWKHGWPYCPEDDDVAGYLTTNQVAEIIAWVVSQP